MRSGCTLPEERVRLFWVLYILDKSGSQRFGIPHYLDSTTCDVRSPQSVIEDSVSVCFAARSHLATLQEEIYKTLYLQKAVISGETDCFDIISTLDLKLQNWRRSYPFLFSAVESNIPKHDCDLLLRLELRYCYSYCQIMLNRADISFAQRALEESRASFTDLRDEYERNPSRITSVSLCWYVVSRLRCFENNSKDQQ